MDNSAATRASQQQSSTPSFSSSRSRPRRRRLQAACTSCRNRRVKCDLLKPACSQCSKRDHVCEYIGTTRSSELQFVIEVPQTSNNVVPSETWKSVFEAQAVDGSNLTLCASAQPLWALAESRALERPSPEANIPVSLEPAVHIESLGEPFLSVLFANLSPRETYSLHFESFASTIHPIMPLYPIDNVREAYAEFWANLSLNTTAELLALVLAILYTGAANTPYNTDSVLIQGMYDKLIVALDLPTYHVILSKSSLHLLHAIILMNTFRASQLTPFTAFGFLPFTIRYAQSLRLHIHQTAGEAMDVESHRRLWWHLVFMDVESTIASGLQGITRSDGQTVHLPAIDNIFNGSGNSSSSPMAIAMQGHWEFTYRMQIWLGRRPEQHDIIHFGRIIEQLLDRISDSNGREWARLYLRMLVDRAYCQIGLRFWELEQFKNTDCHSEVVRTSRSFLEKYVQLAELSKELGFSWFLPGLVQPIHALMILLMHLSGCDHVDEESKLSQDLINQAVNMRVTRITNGQKAHLASDDKPSVSPLNNSRYLALSILRLRVWRRFQWPVVLTPSQQEFQKVDSSEGSLLNRDMEIGSGVDSLDHTIWNDWDSVPSEELGWDDWESLMPNFFADKSYK